MTLTQAEKLQYGRKVLLFLKFTYDPNQAGWTGREKIVENCEVWTCPFETILGGAEPKMQKEVDDPRLHGKLIAVALKNKGLKTGEWRFYYDCYPGSLTKYLYEEARKVEAERVLA